MSRFLLQMHGESGTGKSTLALAVGRATGAVVLDKDRIKGPLVEGGIEDPLAGGLAYDVLWLLVQSALDQGFSVVVDSPAFWPEVLERAQALAKAAAASYRLVECRCEDVAEQERRLRNRPRFASQLASRADLEVTLARPGVVRALDVPHLTVDTMQSPDQCLASVLEYLRT